MAIGGAVAVGVAGGVAAYGLNSCVPEVAATRLHNFVAECDDPLNLNKEDIVAIANRYLLLYLVVFVYNYCREEY